MKNTTFVVVAVAVLAVSGVNVLSKDAIWASDLEAAKAANKGKDIMLAFTGSDWCSVCASLKQEVFDTPEFQAAATGDFVLVDADFPRNKSIITPELAAKNEALAKAYSVHGFPTILLLDGQGRPYAELGYQEGGVVAFLKILKDVKAAKMRRDAAWKKAETASGLEKAKWLAEGLSAIDEKLFSSYYGSVYKEIAAIDPQDSRGALWREKIFGFMRTIKEFYQEDTDAAAAEKKIDKFIADNQLKGVKKQQVMMMKLDLYMPVPPEDLDKVLKILDSVIAVDPATDVAKEAVAIKLDIAEFRKRLETHSAPPVTPAKP